MNCHDTEHLIHGYVDGEMDLVRTLALEDHLNQCPDCAQTHRRLQSLRQAIKAGPLYYQAPKRLDRRVMSELRKANPSASRAQNRSWHWNAWLPTILAPLAAAAAVVFVAQPIVSRNPAGRELEAEINAAHVRSLMVEHKTDVLSSDQHTVKPWFDGKLDFAPPVTDLADRGFPLVGGRLDYITGRSVAALVYRRNLHFINVFVWPAATDEPSPRKVETLHGYNQVHWSASGLTFWAVSDLNATELSAFTQLIQ